MGYNSIVDSMGLSSFV